MARSGYSTFRRNGIAEIEAIEATWRERRRRAGLTDDLHPVLEAVLSDIDHPDGIARRLGERNLRTDGPRRSPPQRAVRRRPREPVEPAPVRRPAARPWLRAAREPKRPARTVISCLAGGPGGRTVRGGPAGLPVS
jgi:hypothetical protein